MNLRQQIIQDRTDELAAQLKHDSDGAFKSSGVRSHIPTFV